MHIKLYKKYIGGHFATGRTHIDSAVHALKVITPTGNIITTQQIPLAGSGPNPNSLFIGSEGAFGIITEAWMKILDEVEYKTSSRVFFTDFFDAIDTLRQIA